ncbi:MAG TPA: GGDEF domain-containing protein [Candidatus Nanoarchaeia archaeon]|nr:GGDEF domain-containing protein [Candidatus Nanoarchaeia archaeon]
MAQDNLGRRAYDAELERLQAEAEDSRMTDPAQIRRLYTAVITHLQAQNAQLHQKLITDPLTGLFNRNTLLERLNAAQREADQLGIPYSVVFADLDDFKKVNEGYGHPIGDRVLQDAATTIRGIVRSDDVLAYRYGGEEVLLVAPRTDETQAARLVERVADEFRKARVGEGYLGHAITITAGAASWHKGMTPAQVIEAANYGMRERKKAGKDGHYLAKRGEIPLK